MDIPRLSDSVERITILRTNSSGGLTPEVVFERKSSKQKRSTGVFRVFERGARRFFEAQRTTADSYLSRHQRSNEKRRDGWIRDLPFNSIKAARRGAKVIKLNRLIQP